MLYLDKPLGPIHGVMVWADHADPNLFYYLPERPRLARNEDGPEFIFLKYRRDITDNPALTADQKQSLGGGFLAYTVDLGIDDATAAQVKSKLGRNATGEVQLAAVPFRKGSVRLSIVKDLAEAPGAPPAQPAGLKFFEQVYGATTPSLYGDNRATFALSLDAEAATLFEAALKSGICPIGVLYDLEFLGLRPSFDVKITADYKRIYDSLDIQFGLQASYASIGLKAEVDLAWQKLRDDGSIKVEVVNFTDDENLRRQSNAAFEFFKTELMRDFFSPAIQPPAYMQSSAGQSAGSGLQSQLASTLPGLNNLAQGPLRPLLGQPSTNAPTPAPPPRNQGSNVLTTSQTNGSVNGPGPAVRPPAHPPTPAPAPAPPAPSQPPANPPAPGQPPASPPAPGQPPASPPAPAQPPANPPAPAQPPANPPGANPPPNPAPNPSPPQRPGSRPTQVPPPATTQAAQPPRGLSTPQNPNAGFGLQLSFTLKQLHQEELKTREFEYSEQDAVAQQVAPQGMFSTMVNGLNLSRYMREISLDDDFFKRINATVNIGSDLAAEGVDSVAVNFEYPANRPAGVPPSATDGVIFKPTQASPHTFTCWLDNSMSLDYQYQMTVQFLETTDWIGKSNTGVAPWIVSRAQALTLDPMSFMGLFDVPISIGVLDASIQQVQIEVKYEDPANSFEDNRTFVMKAGDPPAHWKLRLSDPTLRIYSYRVTYMLANNVRYTTDWTTTENATLVVNSPFNGQLNLRVIPLLDLGNLQEADVQIEYQEPGTGYSRTADFTFAPPALTTQAISIPTLSASPTAYSVATTIVHQDGSVVNPVVTQASAEDTAVIIKEGQGASHRLTVKLPDPNLAGSGLLAIKVLLWGTGAPPDVAEVLFTPSAVGDQKVMLVEPDNSGPWKCSYQVTGYTAKGVPRAGATGSTTDGTILIPLPT